MTSISKNVYNDKLDDIASKYNNTYHSTIKMKPVDARSNTYIDSSKQINNENSKFKIGNIIWISKYNYWPVVISDLKGEKIVGALYENESQKTNQNEVRVKKVLKRIGDKLYVR